MIRDGPEGDNASARDPSPQPPGRHCEQKHNPSFPDSDLLLHSAP
jgi:hypothetical protein